MWWYKYKQEFFFRLSFHNCISCVYNCNDLPSNNSTLCSSQIWFWYTHNFIIIILSWVYNEPIQRPAPSWLGLACTGIAEVKGWNPYKPEFFYQAFFSQLHKLHIYNSDDLHIYDFHIFIISSMWWWVKKKLNSYTNRHVCP